jgi:hypothetical protein
MTLGSVYLRALNTASSPPCRPGPHTSQPFPTTTMHASLIRRQLGGLVPPKVAAPTLLVRACAVYTS